MPKGPSKRPMDGLPAVDEVARLDPTVPIPENMLNADQKARDEATLQRALEAGKLPAAQIYAGAMPNPEGFPIIPWTARKEMNRNVGKWTPSHLHFYTDDEMKPGHYPKAQIDKMTGQFKRFCWACGRPCQTNGVTGKGHAGFGKPCPVCGFRRKREQQPTVPTDFGGVQPAHMNTDMAISPRGPLQSTRQNKATRLNMAELMRERAEERTDAVMDPYFRALELLPKEEWSPSTKLEFYMNQSQVAEKLLNRIEGMPVARTRHVTKDDDDVLRDDELSPSTLVQLVAAMATGADVDVLMGPIEEADFEEVA